MFTRLSELFRTGAMVVSLISGLIIVGCQGGDEAQLPEASTAEAGAPAETTTPPAASPAQTIAGEVSFETGGERHVLDYLPADENYYRRLASAIIAKPDRDATEQLRITFLGTDLRKVEIPGELPPSRDITTMTIETAMQAVGFSWIDADGEEWAGPGRIHVESFDGDGTLVATFSDVTLPHTDKEKPDLTLTNGSVSAKLE